jgi:hypothetical protein
MKKFIIILFSSIILIGTGCEDFLKEDLKGKLLGDAAVSTQVGLESALTGAYFGLGYSWSYGFLNGYDIEVTAGGEDVTAVGDRFDKCDVNDQVGNLKSVYIGCYKAIQNANNVIANYQNAAGDPATTNIIAGEAYFLRALSYYWLVRLFGAIPLLTSPEFSMDVYTIEKTDPLEVYQLIEDDLTQAEQLLADNKRDFGRPNKGSAKAFLADVYLTEGGWPLKNTSKYEMAASKAKEVIDNHETYGFQLLPTFAAVFENDTRNNASAEEIFAIATNTADWRVSNNRTGWYCLPSEVGGWDAIFAEINFFKNFPDGPRKDATFATTFTLSDGTVLTWEELVTGHPYYKKLQVKEGDPGYYHYQSSLPVSMMRYAHILTIYAEAKARSGGPDQLAYDCINSIRVRAGLPPLEGLSASDFAAAVVQERAWEFAAEKTRWFDLVRLEMVEEAITPEKRDPKENTLSLPITKEDYIFPFPSSDVFINPNLLN